MNYAIFLCTYNEWIWNKPFYIRKVKTDSYLLTPLIDHKQSFEHYIFWSYNNTLL